MFDQIAPDTGSGATPYFAVGEQPMAHPSVQSPMAVRCGRPCIPILIFEHPFAFFPTRDGPPEEGRVSLPSYACARRQPLIEWRPNPSSLASHCRTHRLTTSKERWREGARDRGKGAVRERRRAHKCVGRRRRRRRFIYFPRGDTATQTVRRCPFITKLTGNKQMLTNDLL